MAYKKSTPYNEKGDCFHLTYYKRHGHNKAMFSHCYRDAEGLLWNTDIFEDWSGSMDFKELSLKVLEESKSHLKPLKKELVPLARKSIKELTDWVKASPQLVE